MVFLVPQWSGGGGELVYRYVLHAGWSYEGEDLIGLHGTTETLERHIADLEKEGPLAGYDYLEVVDVLEARRCRHYLHEDPPAPLKWERIVSTVWPPCRVEEGCHVHTRR